MRNMKRRRGREDEKEQEEESDVLEAREGDDERLAEWKKRRKERPWIESLAAERMQEAEIL